MADRLRAAVLGCGPAGLLAAHGIMQAAEERRATAEVQIYSSKRKSPLFGCQYLHQAIPGLKLPIQHVDYRLTGSISGYREKVYGTSEDIAVSPDMLEADHYAWNIRDAYDQLWDKYESSIEDYFLSRASWKLLWDRLMDQGVSLIISTVPAPVMCMDGHNCTFESETVWAMGDAPEMARWAKLPVELPDGTILCSGKESHPWYRVSHVFGHHTVEWPKDAEAPRGASRVTKPIRTSCPCNPAIVRSGRYARWKKGVLAHESFFDGYSLAKKELR